MIYNRSVEACGIGSTLGYVGQVAVVWWQDAAARPAATAREVNVLCSCFVVLSALGLPLVSSLSLPPIH